LDKARELIFPGFFFFILFIVYPLLMKKEKIKYIPYVEPEIELPFVRVNSWKKWNSEKNVPDRKSKTLIVHFYKSGNKIESVTSCQDNKLHTFALCKANLREYFDLYRKELESGKEVNFSIGIHQIYMTYFK